MKDHQARTTAELYREVDACRMCKSRSLVPYLNLGHTPPADQFRREEELRLPEISYPLRVVVCRDCGLSQLTHVVDPRVLYQYDYPYESSTTATGAAHWQKFAELAIARLGLTKGSLVVDVGSNDGTLLSKFKAQGMKVVGVDPAKNIAVLARKRGIPTIADFFTPAVARTIKSKYGKASLIVGTNVFAHIDDLDAVLKAAKSFLTPSGAFVFESPHFQHLVEKLEYDTIYHEHVSYLSLSPVVKFVRRFGMEVFAVEESEIHGGSFRVYIGMTDKHPIDSSVKAMIAREKKAGIHSVQVLKKFAERVAENRRKLMKIIDSLAHDGKRIAVVSTPAKGMTLLNYNGISKWHVQFATEKSPLKIGRVTPGAHILIVPDSELLDAGIDYALLLAWNFATEIMHNNQEFIKRGGKFIIPIPEPRIIP